MPNIKDKNTNINIQQAFSNESKQNKVCIIHKIIIDLRHIYFKLKVTCPKNAFRNE